MHIIQLTETLAASRARGDAWVVNVNISLQRSAPLLRKNSAPVIDPERNFIVNAKRKNRKVDRFNPGQSSLRNQATEKRNYAPFRQLSHGPLDLRGIIEKNEHVAAILSTLQIENDKLTRKLRKLHRF